MKKSQKYLLATGSLLIFLTALVAYNTSPVAAQGELGTAAPELEGAWRVTVTPDDPNPPFLVFHTFARGGVILESNQLGQSPGHGVWERKGPHTFGFTFEKLLFDPNGNFIGKLKVREKLDLRTRNSYTGRSTAEVFDPAGRLIVSFCATSQATRMIVEEPSCS